MPQRKSEPDRIRELEDALEETERHIAEMRAERDQAFELVEQMKEHVSDVDALIDRDALLRQSKNLGAACRRRRVEVRAAGGIADDQRKGLALGEALGARRSDGRHNGQGQP